MKKTMLPFLILMLGMLFCGDPGLAQNEDTLNDGDPPAAIKKFEKYEDFIVKGYSLTFSAGHFAGGTYLNNQVLAPKAYIFNGIYSYFPTPADNGEYVHESLMLDSENRPVYDAAQKKAEPGDGYSLKVGIYIADNFHLDMAGSYVNSRASTTMLHMIEEDSENNPRVEVDFDDGFKIYKGGLALMYDAEPAKFLGITPRLGFGLGGIINRFSELQDKTALFLEGNFALSYQLFDNLNLVGQVDSATFAFEVDELGYSNMVHYTNYSIGACWFIDVLPSDIRARHQAGKR
ncbi:MAG: hypothetical protein KOO60_06610 [Gemmatimonadales bacterium]|nr:hypothetical protein [Gemmatimonadales bacterium]